MTVGGRESRVGGSLLGLFGPFASFAVGVILGARISPLVSELARRLDF